MNNYVTLPYAPDWAALDWAKENCPSYITNSVTVDYNTLGYPNEYFITYYFGNEKEMLMFRLRWS